MKVLTKNDDYDIHKGTVSRGLVEIPKLSEVEFSEN